MNAMADNANDTTKAKSDSGEADNDANHDENRLGQANNNIHLNLTLVRWLNQSSKEGPYDAIDKCTSGTGDSVATQNQVADDDSSSLGYLALGTEADALDQGENLQGKNL